MLYTFKYDIEGVKIKGMRPQVEFCVVSSHGNDAGEARARVATWLNLMYEPDPLYKPYDVKIVMMPADEVIFFATNAEGEDDFQLTECPYCGDRFLDWECEDNDPICHAICIRCDKTYSWDSEGWWPFDRLCTCGKPAILNVSNGFIGCLDETCPDYQSDGLTKQDYAISGYKGVRRQGELDDDD